MTGSTGYGVMTDIVRSSGAIIATSLAIGQAWRGRTSWEPSEEDVSRGPQKVGSLAAAVLIVIVWAQTGPSTKGGVVAALAAALVASTIVFLIVYGFVVATQTYERVIVVGGDVVTQKIVGGYVLTARAKERLKQDDLTVQELLKGAAYDPDKIWTRPSRALAKSTFVVSYLGLTICGTVALASGAVLVGRTVG